MGAWRLFVLTVTVGCGSPGFLPDSPDATSGGAGAPASTVTGMPCSIRDVLAARCVSCHSDPPAQSTPMALTTYADLTAPSKGNPTKTIADLCLSRMKDAKFPMPPAPNAPATAAEISALEGWLNAGMPMGTCAGIDAGTGEGGNPYGTPTVCTSGTYWKNGDTGSAEMHPGVACRTCHVLLGKATKKELDIAGTVYPTAHEPDDGTGATVVITDANNQDHAFPVNAAGNFFHDDAFGFSKIPMPYRAKVIRNGKTRSMTAAQTDGNCNACHTTQGAQKAPGRIMAP